MLLQNFKGKFDILSFIFFGGILSGVILIGVNSSFSLMLSERGVHVSAISTILVATIPYGWKFLISPIIKNTIMKFSNRNFDVLKIIAYLSQCIMFFGFASLGLFGKTGSLALSGAIIFIITIAVSVHDIICAHIKLTTFEKKDLGIVNSISNTGFRIGIFIAGACLLYIAEYIGWKFSFFIISLVSVIAAFFSMFIVNIKQYNISVKQEAIKSIGNYIKVAIQLFKKYGIVFLISIIISFKFSDSCINVLKPMFLHSIGIKKIIFANISQIMGVFTMILGGILAGIATYRIGTEKCINFSFFAQAFASSLFVFLSYFKTDLLTITIFINISTLIFGFSNVIFRTFISEESKKDVNIYMMLISIGAVARIASYYIGGIIAETYSWGIIYMICILSNIPGIYFYTKLSGKRYKSI